MLNAEWQNIQQLKIQQSAFSIQHSAFSIAIDASNPLSSPAPAGVRLRLDADRPPSGRTAVLVGGRPARAVVASHRVGRGAGRSGAGLVVRLPLRAD